MSSSEGENGNKFIMHSMKMNLSTLHMPFNTYIYHFVSGYNTMEIKKGVDLNCVLGIGFSFNRKPLLHGIQGRGSIYIWKSLIWQFLHFFFKTTSVIMHVVRVVWHCLLLSVGLIFLLVLGLALVRALWYVGFYALFSASVDSRVEKGLAVLGLQLSSI